MTDIVPSPQIEELKQQCELLRDEVATLLADHDHLVGTVGPNIVAIYATKIGVKEYEALSLDVEVRRLKATIEKIQAIENQSKKANLEQIEAAVEDELKVWKDKVDKMLDEITASQKRLNNQMTEAESTELQKLYHMLAKKLHPDLNPDLTDNHKQLWNRVQHAYATGNLQELRALVLMIDDIPDAIDMPNQVEQLEKRCTDLKRKVRDLLREIASLKREPPYSLAVKLDDAEWVDQQISECKVKIDMLSEQKKNLEEWLSMWKKKV
jgi:archaellum component FlaC